MVIKYTECDIIMLNRGKVDVMTWVKVGAVLKLPELIDNDVVKSNM